MKGISREKEKQLMALAKEQGVNVVRSTVKQSLTVPLRGEPRMQILVVLPWPPALNNLYANTKDGRILSWKGKTLKSAVALAVREQNIDHVTGRLSVEAWAHPPNAQKRDLDGLWKATLDSLQAAGVFADDEQIDHLTIHRGAIEYPGRIVLSIKGDFPK